MAVQVDPQGLTCTSKLEMTPTHKTRQTISQINKHSEVLALGSASFQSTVRDFLNAYIYYELVIKVQEFVVKNLKIFPKILRFQLTAGS